MGRSTMVTCDMCGGGLLIEGLDVESGITKAGWITHEHGGVYADICPKDQNRFTGGHVRLVGNPAPAPGDSDDTQTHLQPVRS